MDNATLGIITVIICSLLGFFSWKSFFQDKNYGLAVSLLVICGLILRLYVGADLYLHSWDERYHALVAKNLMAHPLLPTLYDTPLLHYDYRDWSTNHIWVHKQPLPLWLMAFSMSLFGVNEIAFRLPSILLSAGAVLLTYKIGQYLFSRKIGYIAACLHAIHGLILELTGGRVATDHIDLFFLFFVELAVFFAILHARKKDTWLWLVLMSVATGLAILCKWLPALIVLPVWFLLHEPLIHKSYLRLFRDGLLALLIIAIVVLPWQWYIYVQFPLEAAWESQHHLKHIFEALDKHGQPFYFHWDKMRMIFGELIYIPLFWFLWKSVRKGVKSKNTTWLALTCWIIIPYLFFSLVKTKMQAYIIFTAPALFILTALFWHYLRQLKPANKNYRYFFSFLAIFLLLLPLRYSIERIKPFSDRDRNPVWSQQLKNLKAVLPKGQKIALFHTEHFIEAMFYGDDVIAYPDDPSQAVLDTVTSQGYEAYFLNKDGTVRLLKKSASR